MRSMITIVLPQGLGLVIGVVGCVVGVVIAVLAVCGIFKSCDEYNKKS